MVNKNNKRVRYPSCDYSESLPDKVPMVFLFGKASAQEIAWAYGHSVAYVLKAWRDSCVFVDVEVK